MNLYLVSQTINANYDTYDVAVVAAETAEDATFMHPIGVDMRERPDFLKNDSWTTPEHVTATLIGVAVDGTEPGVISVSYNAS